MSDYGFNDYSGDDQGQGQGSAEPKWFRDRMDKLAGEVSELRAENAALKETRRTESVADALKAQGYSPAAASLYQGKPEELNGWLEANKDALARLPEVGGESGQELQETAQQSGPPQTTVPPEMQTQMRLISEAGTTGVAPSQGSDQELAARIRAAKTPEEYAQIMAANGSPHQW